MRQLYRFRWLSRQALLQIHTLLFPTCCESCQCVIAHGDVPLCPSCRAALDTPLAEDLKDLLHHPDIGLSPIRADALWFYDRHGPVRKLIQRIKYNGEVQLGRRLGYLLGRKLAASSMNIDVPDVVTPIPIHDLRRRERGYNQAEIIAQGVADALGKPVHTECLSRARISLSQVGKGRAARMENLKNAFTSDRSTDASGGHLLLVDDVITTGATVAAACDALKKSGFNRISIAALAIVRL